MPAGALLVVVLGVLLALAGPSFALAAAVTWIPIAALTLGHDRSMMGPLPSSGPVDAGLRPERDTHGGAACTASFVGMPATS